MTYPQDIDEISAFELAVELKRRAVRIRSDQCDYCNRIYSSEPCRFPNRHNKNQAMQIIQQAFEILADTEVPK